MNESFRVQLQLNGVLVPITELRTDGLIFANETDAWPRRFAVSLVPQSDTADYRMRRVRQINDWTYPEYRLRMTVTDGCLVFSGVTPDGLPSGDFWLSLDIEDLPAVATRYKVYIPDDGHADVPFAVKLDPRKVELKPEPLDQDIQRILSASTLDGMAVAAWLQDSTRRPSRKACLLNLMAKVRSIPWQDDPPMKPLIREVDRVFFAGTERVYATVTPGFYEDLQGLARDPKHPFYLEGTPKAPIHRLLLARAAVTSPYDLFSFRQEGKTCMQAVVAVPRQRGEQYYADLDIDLGNPLQDVQGFIIHMTELLGSGITDHIALFKKLSDDAHTGPYIGYNVSA